MPVNEKQQLKRFKFPLTSTTTYPRSLQPSKSPRNRSVLLPSETPVPPSRLPRLRPPPLNLNALPQSPISAPLRTPTKIPIRDSYGETGLLCSAPIRCRPFTKPDPRLLLRHLRTVLGPEALKIQGNLGIDDLIALHEREMMEKQEKEIIKARPSNHWNLSIFGTSLRQVSLYASTTAILGGYEHDLPVLVFACVEELYQRGLKNSIYSDPPSILSPRVADLQNLFNSSPSYGIDVLLEPESEEDIYFLLLSFLQRLPEPVLGSTQIVEGIKQSIWEWCVLTTTGRRRLRHSISEGGASVVYIEEEKDERLYRKSLMDAVVSSTHRADADESTQITIVQHLLRLLPSANLSTFVYLLAFLNQIVASLLGSDRMDSATINSEREELGRLFGKWIFGNRIRDSWGSEEQVDASAVMMVWFLTRWETIVDGLFSMGKTRKPAEQEGNKNDTSQEPSAPKTLSPGPASSKHGALEELLALLSDNNVKTLDTSSIKSIEADEADAPEHENLLDVRLPTLDSSSSGNIDSEANSPTSVSSFASSSRVRLPSINDSGFRVLESKFQMQNLNAKLEPSDFCGSPECKSYTVILEERLRTAMKERDEAWAIVDDIRRMMADASA